MQGSHRTFKRKSDRHRCRWCGKSAAFPKQDGSLTADGDHDLCHPCFKKALRIGLRKAAKIL